MSQEHTLGFKMRMETVLHETCQQYVARRLSEGWRIAGRYKHLVFLSPPDGSFIRPVDLRNDVEILRPNAAGDYENIDYATSGVGNHWKDVDDVVPDEGSTHIRTNSTTQEKDAYNLQDTSIPVGAKVNSVRVYFRIKTPDRPGQEQPFLRLGGYETAGTAIVPWTPDYKTFSEILARPGGGFWSRADLNSLQVVIGMKSFEDPITWIYCTQVYVEIDYIPLPTVTTQAVDNIGTTTATGHGNITDDGGGCSKRGVCWNTTGNPTVAHSKSEQTDSFGIGPFTRPMTGLTPGQHYYVKAYAYNSAGYGYGGQVEFTTTVIAYKDIAARFRLRVQPYQDVATRFRLNLGYYKDTATRFKLITPASMDIGTRFRLLPPAQHKDVSTRFFLYQPSWKSLQILKDIAELEATAGGLGLKPRAHFEI